MQIHNIGFMTEAWDINSTNKQVDSSKLYIIENHKEGMYQIGIMRGNMPDPANDETIEVEVVDYYGTDN